MRRMWYLITFSIVAVVVLSPAAGAQGNGQTVSIQDFFFSPAQLNVQPGTTVTWTNQGKAPHTVTADDGSFDSETLQPGQSFSHTFQSTGTVAYHCEIHPFMTASVTVGGGGGKAAGSSEAKAGGAQAKAAPPSALAPAAKAQLPKTGGIPNSAAVLGLVGGGVLVVGMGLIARRIIR